MYMSIEDIQARSRRIPALCDATQEEVEFWIEEASDIIHDFCQQNFKLEKQVIKRVRATTNTLVHLPKTLGGEVTVFNSSMSPVFSSATGLTNSDVELFTGTFHLGWYKNNSRYRNIPVNTVSGLNSGASAAAGAETLFVKGDWGFYLTEEALLVDAANTMKTLYEAHRVDAAAHLGADTVNVVTLTDATDTATAILLINNLKAVIEAHLTDITVHNVSDDANVTSEPAATDSYTAFVLLQDIKYKYNSHISKTGSGSPHVVADQANVAYFSTDCEGSVLPSSIRRVFLRLVQRLAIREDAEDLRQLNSPYSNETLGDGYTYSLDNGTLRNLLRPDEANMLRPYVNRGRIVI